jgi:hypothetical protein
VPEKSAPEKSAPAKPATATDAAPPQPPPAAPPQPAPSKPAPAVAETTDDLDAQILQAAGELGYDAAKVRRWVNQKFEVTGGLGSLTAHDKREVLKIFREQSDADRAKTARK